MGQQEHDDEDYKWVLVLLKLCYIYHIREWKSKKGTNKNKEQSKVFKTWNGWKGYVGGVVYKMMLSLKIFRHFVRFGEFLNWFNLAQFWHSMFILKHWSSARELFFSGHSSCRSSDAKKCTQSAYFFSASLIYCQNSSFKVEIVKVLYKFTG